MMPPDLHSIGFNRKELRSEIEIDAKVAQVWRILTDFEKFPDWNPFVREVSGRLEQDQKLKVTLKPSGGRTTKFSPKIVVCEANRELRWVGHVGVPGLFDGEHSFEMRPLGETRTLFVQREQFGGILLPLLTGMLRNSTARGFSEMNQALKRRAEEKEA